MITLARIAELNARTHDEVRAARQTFRAEFGKPPTLHNLRWAAAATDVLLCITEGANETDPGRARALRRMKVIQEAAP